MTHRPTVLVLLGCFSRGVEATGPNQSMLGMAERLSHRYRFRVIGQAVEGDVPGRWTELKGVEQLPLAHGRLRVAGLRRAIAETPHDVLITNSVFDPQFTGALLLYRRLRLVPSRPVLLAPRGELGAGSLTLGGFKKRTYVRLLKAGGLLDGVTFQATSEAEAREIRATMGASRPICVTPNIRTIPDRPAHAPRAPGQPLRLVYLSRIDRKKNLDFALRVLRTLAVPAQLDVYGPVSDPGYWTQCQALAAELPPTVAMRYHGTLAQAQVIETLARYDAFVLPTRNENFGHAIADALLAGTPALLSDETPWRGLQAAGAGWDLPLTQPVAFTDALQQLAAASPAEAATRRDAARRFAEERLDPNRAAAQLELCLDRLIAEQAVAR